MYNYLELLPNHKELYIGETDLFLEVYENKSQKKAPILLLHGAYTGSWMYCKYIPKLYEEGYAIYVMNLRGHYKSRSIDLTKVTFDDYLDDIEQIYDLILKEEKEKPTIIGFSMGGLLAQKISERKAFNSMILIDSSIPKEVHQKVPYSMVPLLCNEIIDPSPYRNETKSIDESETDITFQKKYLSMESANAINAIRDFSNGQGISVDNTKINIPVLVMKVENNMESILRGETLADFFSGTYCGVKNSTHTGILIGNNYEINVRHIIDFLQVNKV